MPDDPLSRILEAYPVVHHACRRRQVRDRASGRTVSAHQATILGHLDRSTGLTLGQLAAHMGVTPATMSLLASRLTHASLIRRERDPEDGRRVLLRLTPQGLRIRSEHSLLDPERVRRVLDQLNPAERSLGAEGLTALARAARRLAEPPTSRHPRRNPREQ